MARRNKQNRPEAISGGYSAIPWAVLDSLSFTGATDKAKALLFALMRQHNGSNNGHLHLTKGWLAKQGYTCPASNIKARDELLERCLIVQTAQGGLNMGANLYALTWHDITNFVGLDITSKSYSRSAYLLCKLSPTQRRKQPTKKQNERFTECNWSGSLSETVDILTSSVSEPEMVLIDTLAVSHSEPNVITPLPVPNLTNARKEKAWQTHLSSALKL